MQIDYLKTSTRMALQGHYRGPVSAALLYFAILILADSLTPGQTASDGALNLIGLGISVVVSILMYIFKAGQARISLQILKGEQEVGKDTYYGFRSGTDRYLYFGLVKTLMELVFVGVTYMLLMGADGMNPGRFIMAAVWFLLGGLCYLYISLSISLTLPILVDDETMDTTEAIKESIRLMKGMHGKLFFMYLSFIGWIVLCVMSLGVGLLLVSPYVITTKMNFYLNLKNATK
ncbi:MAG: DUF975 family protein [Lachnospiraceae bacterium]|nr:DUF975 family protein [Candidatus Equihabitans merdae]